MGAQKGNIKNKKAIAGARHHGGRPAARISRRPLSSGEQWSRIAKRIGGWGIAKDANEISTGERPRRQTELVSRQRQ